MLPGGLGLKFMLMAEDKTGGAFSSALAGMSKFADEFRSFEDHFKQAAAGVQQFGEIMSAAFEFGREGAVMTQTRESFQQLMLQMEMGPGVLRELTSAAGGTVSEFELMSATTTLLAGANEELAREMVDAAPRLLEIARAAIKLNPALGDVTTLYEDLARGIKRSSPMIIDNTGLLVKVGAANEAFARSLGKTVEELTAGERSMALLNATLEAGDVMIEQVGGRIESATDPFDRLDASVVNLKEGLANLEIFGRTYVEWISDAAVGLTNLVEGVQGVIEATEEHKEGIIETSQNYGEYADAMLRAGYWIDLMTEAEWDATQAEEALNYQRERGVVLNERYSMGFTEGVTPALVDSGVQVDIVRASLRELNDQMLFNKLSANLSAESQLLLARQMGLLNEETYATLTAAALLQDQMDAGTVSAGYYDAAIRSLALAHQLSAAPSMGVISAPAAGQDVYQDAYDRAREVFREQRGYQHGGRGVVPAGYPDDSYMIGLSSGEEFAVAPRGQGLGGGGVTFIYSPMFSTADEAEAESTIKPVIQGVVREMIAGS